MLEAVATPARVLDPDRVRVLPNHACTTAVVYDRFHTYDGQVWTRVGGW